jgi:hypothetical protein
LDVQFSYLVLQELFEQVGTIVTVHESEDEKEWEKEVPIYDYVWRSV